MHVGRLQVSWESNTLPLDFKILLRENIHGVLECPTEKSNETLGYVSSNAINGRNLFLNILLHHTSIIFAFFITQDYAE